MTVCRNADDGLDRLRARTKAVVNDLRQIRSTDPAAENAIRVVRLTEHTLEVLWLPALEAPIR